MLMPHSVAGAVLFSMFATQTMAIPEDVGTKVRSILNTDVAATRINLDNQFFLDGDGHYLGGVYTASGSASWTWIGLGALALGGGIAALAGGGGGGDSDSGSSPAQTRRTPDYSGMPAGGPQPTDEDHQTALGLVTTEFALSHHSQAINQHYALARGITGQGVTIAITGNGVHQPEGSELADAYLGQVDLFEKYSGETDTTTSGSKLHETLVASVLVGKRNQAGGLGIAPDAKLIDFKISRHDYSGIIPSTRVDDMVREMMGSGARVFSQSWDYVLGDPDYFYERLPHRLEGFREIATELEKLYTIAGGKGGVWVTAAGNRGADNPNYYMAAMPRWFPALETQMVAVVAIDGPFDPTTTAPGDLVLAPYSSACGEAKNWCIAAPGDAIISTTADGTPQFFSGTSAATPIVAGSLAVIMSAFPEIAAETAVKILLDTAVDLGAPGVDEVFGHGMPDLEKALRPVGGTTIQAADGGTQSAQSSRLDVPASFGSAFDGAVTYTF